MSAMRTFASDSQPGYQAKSSSSEAQRGRTVAAGRAGSVLNLQRTHGNQTVQRLLRAGPEDVDPSPATATSKSVRTSTFPQVERIQPLFGKHDLGDVRTEVGGAAARIASQMDALAYTSGESIGFKHSPDLRLAAHEAAHVIQQRKGIRLPGGLGRVNDVFEWHADSVADRVVKNQDASALLDAVPATGYFPAFAGPVIQLEAPRDTYPWVGEISGTWSAALRRTPNKSETDPHLTTEADLPRGSEIMVTGRRGGWLHVSVRIDGVDMTGYVSQELVRYVRASSLDFDPEEITIKIPSVAEAFVILKRAETQAAAQGTSFKPSEEEESEIGLAISVLKGTGTYLVDPTTFTVNFVETVGKKVDVTTIEDFILFVEQVERQYPSAKPSEIASEIRQLWFSDVNWELLVSSSGITSGGKLIDIETPPDPIATRFNMLTLAPAKGGKQISTRFGSVDIGHVMAGIDAALSPFPASYPKHHLKLRGHDDSDTELKYKTLKAASGGQSRDFTTWAGDLGQAYAEFLVDRYVKSNSSAKLKTFVTDKAPPDELLGDIHGYIAVEVWKAVPQTLSPSGGAFKVSNILRDLYLVRKTSGKNYRHYSEQVAGVHGSKFRTFVIDRSKAFARPWFAKKAFEHKGFWGSEGWSEEAVLNNWLKEFDRVDALHESSAKVDEQLSKVVDDFMSTLSGKVD